MSDLPLWDALRRWWYLLQHHEPDFHVDQDRWLFIRAVNPLMSGVTSSSHGQYASGRLHDGATDYIRQTFKVPSDFVSLTSLHAVVISPATGNIYWSATSEFAENGEAYNSNTGTIAYRADPLTINMITELPDCSSILAGLTAEDYVGLLFIRDSTNILDTVDDFVEFLGWIFKYKAEQ